jgi:hypothetical protein
MCATARRGEAVVPTRGQLEGRRLWLQGAREVWGQQTQSPSTWAVTHPTTIGWKVTVAPGSEGGVGTATAVSQHVGCQSSRSAIPGDANCLRGASGGLDPRGDVMSPQGAGGIEAAGLDDVLRWRAENVPPGGVQLHWCQRPATGQPVQGEAC